MRARLLSLALITLALTSCGKDEAALVVAKVGETCVGSLEPVALGVTLDVRAEVTLREIGSTRANMADVQAWLVPTAEKHPALVGTTAAELETLPEWAEREAAEGAKLKEGEDVMLWLVAEPTSWDATLIGPIVEWKDGESTGKNSLTVRQDCASTPTPTATPTATVSTSPTFYITGQFVWCGTTPAAVGTTVIAKADGTITDVDFEVRGAEITDVWLLPAPSPKEGIAVAEPGTLEGRAGWADRRAADGARVRKGEILQLFAVIEPADEDARVSGPTVTWRSNGTTTEVNVGSVPVTRIDCQ